MTAASRRVAGILLIIMPTVVLGGASVLTLLVNDAQYADNGCARTCGAPDTPTKGCCCCSH